MTDPRQNSLVRFSDKDLPEEYQGQYPMKYDTAYIFIGEIPNMRGHCIVMDYMTGETFIGYHIEHFTELEEGEDIV